MIKLTSAALAAVAIGALIGPGLASPAMAKSVDVKGTTVCSTGIKGKIKAGPRDTSRMKTNVQIDDVGTVSRVWSVTVVGGSESVTREVTTGGLSNSLDQDFFTSDAPGTDTITFTATRAGATCSGTVTVG